MSFRYAIRIAYDGTGFCGWQKQSGQQTGKTTSPSIEELVSQSVESVFPAVTSVVASGRTDAGVHANGQVAHFSVSRLPDSEKNLLHALNHPLPSGIRIHQIARVPTDFSARSAIAKQYSYYFLEGPAPLPHLHGYSRWSHRTLDVEALNEAAPYLIGNHDFAAFGRSSAQVNSTIRRIDESEISKSAVPLPGCDPSNEYQLVRLRLRGSGFLKQMVRRIVGTLILVGENRANPDRLGEILATQNTSLVGDTAPANGLWLDRVWYREDSSFPFPDHEDAKDDSFAR